MTGHQFILRAMIADLEGQYGASVVLPITADLSRADEKLRDFYQKIASERKTKAALA